jgi:DNA-directed RNA polymerase specialized sigma24 family protein
VSIESVTFTVHREKQSQFEELLLPHLDGAYNVAFWLIQNERDARAIVEEAYVQARREFEKLGATDTRVWLYKIVLRIAYTWIQQQNHRSKVGFLPNDFSGKAKPLPTVQPREPLTPGEVS